MFRLIGNKRHHGTRRPGPCASEARQGSSRHQPSTPSPTPNRAWPGSHAPAREHDARGNGGGFAALEAFCRRVAGVSRLYWCNSPRLLAPSTWSELDRGPLTAQFPRLVAPSTLGELDRGPLMARIPRLLVVRPRFGAARRPHRRPTRRQTSTTGCRRRGGLRSGYNGALPRAPLARSPLRCEREPAIACANPQYRT